MPRKKSTTKPKAKAQSLTEYEDEVMAIANEPRKKGEKGLDLWLSAYKRHGLTGGKLKFSHTSNLADDINQSYTLGCVDSNTAIVMLIDGENSSLMHFTPRQLEELKFRIDDVLVEMGLISINVMSANDHVWKTSPRRK